jgi:hypothetical protein
MSINFPSDPTLNQEYTSGSKTWVWNGRGWQVSGTNLGYTGSQGVGYTGSQGVEGAFAGMGYTGSKGDPDGYTGSIGYTGSAGYVGSQGIDGAFAGMGYTGSLGYAGSRGYTGSQGNLGYAGSRGTTGFTGSQGDLGYVGSQGNQGYDGSVGDQGYTGSAGYVGSQGNPGEAAAIGYTGSQGPAGGYTGSQGDAGYTGSIGSVGYAGSTGDTGGIGYTGSQGVLISNRTTTIVYTGTINNDASANVSIDGFKGYLLYKIGTSAASWVRIYTDQAARTSDASRTITTDPSANSGLVAEVITTGNSTVRLTPGAVGFNDEATPTTSIPLAITNKSGASANISVTLTIVKYED